MTEGEQRARDFAATFAEVAGPGVLVRAFPGPPVYDPLKGELVPQAPITADLLLHVSDYRSTQVDGRLILAGDRLCIVQALGLTVVPTITDRITETPEGGEPVTYEVVTTERAAVRGVAICWRLQVRGAP